jgi:hypothetical protein
MLPVKHREIIEEHRFADELARIITDAKRADEFIDGARWLLSRNPKSGTRISTSEVWFLPMEEIPGILPVILYYTFDDDFVNFLSIQETIYPPKDEDE